MFHFIRKLMMVILLVGLVVACNAEPEADVAATVAASLSATQTAQPTVTAVPTNTPVPTDTPTPLPTETAVPTDTPVPTATPEPTATATPEPNIIETVQESGDVLYESPTSGISFTLPSDWVVFDLTTEDFSAAFGAVSEQNESLSFFSTEYAQALIASGMKFYALNATPDSLGSGTPFSINVIAEEILGDFTASQYATLTVGQLEQIFDLEGQIEKMTVMVGDEEAIRLSYTVELVSAVGVPIEALNTQYLFVRDGRAYIVTVSISEEFREQYLESARAAAETFRFLEPAE